MAERFKATPQQVGALWVRVAHSGTRRGYVPVGSAAASLPPTVPECTIHTHVTGSTARGIEKLRFKAIMTRRPSVERMIKRLKCDLGDD